MNKIAQKVGRTSYKLVWPALYVYLLVGARTRVLVRVNGHVLLVKGWLDDGRWGLPGGGLHHGELPADGAAREVREEAGVTLEPTNITLLASEWHRRNGLRYYSHFMETTLSGKPVDIPLQRQRGEIVAVEWVPLAKLHTYSLKPEVQRALQLSAKR